MKLGPVEINLAKKPTPQIGTEIGTSANGSLPSIFNSEFVDMSKIKVADFKKMLDNDGTVQALYNTIVMPILGSNWTIEADDDSPQAVEQSTKVEDWLRTPPHKGGMSTPFDLVLAQATRAVLEGYAGFEKVLEVKDGYIVFRKIAWRDPTTIGLRTDDRGGFNGFKQRAFIGDRYDEVTIPLERSFLYTYGKEFHNLKGRSAFTSAYSSYDKKRRLYYLSEQQAQSDALKIKVVKATEKKNQDELDATVEAVDELGFKATVGLPVGFDVSALNQNGGLDLLPLIEHHNAEMARSVLAMFILLGTGSKTGSYSLSQDQSDFFIQALKSVRNSLATHITSYLIPDLYNYNFEKPLYGTFKFEDLTDSTIELLKQVFIKLTEKDKLPQEVIDGVVQKVADKLDIDVTVLDKATSGVDDSANKDDTSNDVPVSNTRKLSLSSDGWRREYTPTEKKVNFVGIDKKLNSLEAEYERSIRPIYDEIVLKATSKLNTYLEDKDYDKITEKNLFDENLRNQYTKTIKESGLEAYIYGKNGASDEIGKKAPATPKESKDFFRDNAKSVADKQFADLIFKVNAKVAEGRRKDQLSKDLSIGEVLAGISALFQDFYTSIVGITASAVVAMGVNKGRKDVFADNASDIASYQYSAILDTKTCPICDDLDAKVVDEAEYKRTTFDPPVHHHCRCIWVAILKDELDQPPITGLPVAPGGVTEPSLSKDTGEIQKLNKKVSFLFDALATNIADEEFSTDDEE
jgi:SPP1 gp7 family putative phage head morphogenesis protein